MFPLKYAESWNHLSPQARGETSDPVMFDHEISGTNASVMGQIHKVK